MINFIKSIIPNLLLIIGWFFDLIAKGTVYLSNLITYAGIKLHINLNTKLGKEFKAIESAVQAAVQQIQNMQRQLNEQRASYSNESNRLANIIKGNNDSLTQIVSLRKKNDDEPKN
jgi:phage-related protein